jgi:hypothetical protein
MRIRSTKPEFWRSKTIATLDWGVRLVLKGLESYVDDNGVGKDDIALIAADVFPRDLSGNPPETLARLSEAISELHAANLVARYQVDGEELLYIDRWKDLQRIDKPARGRFRRPDGTLEYSEDVARESYRKPREDVARAPEVPAPGAVEQWSSGAGSLVSEVADAPSDDESDDEPPRDELREDIELVCRHLVEVMVGAGCRKPAVTNRWRDHARLMIDKDGREPDRIIRAIDWAWNDDFWRGKIESIPKLRIQYDKLRIAAGKGSKSNVTPVDFGAQPKDPKDRPLYAPDDVRSRWVK